jgi:hypothetical protein
METAWSRLARTRSAGEVRDVLRSSAWGDPGAASTREILTGMRLAWADRVVGGVPEAAGWARAAAALLVAGAWLLEGERPSEAVRARAAYVLGPAFVRAAVEGVSPLPSLQERLPPGCRWVLDGIGGPDDLWRAEGAWWHRVEDDGFTLVRRASFGRPTVVGTLAVLAVDAWRVRGALEVAARGGGPAREVFDAVA